MRKVFASGVCAGARYSRRSRTSVVGDDNVQHHAGLDQGMLLYIPWSLPECSSLMRGVLGFEQLSTGVTVASFRSALPRVPASPRMALCPDESIWGCKIMLSHPSERSYLACYLASLTWMPGQPGHWIREVRHFIHLLFKSSGSGSGNGNGRQCGVGEYQLAPLDQRSRKLPEKYFF